MGWLWLLWFVYWLPVIHVWCFVYLRLRPKRRRVTAWAAASVLAVIWPLFVPQFWWWVRRHPAMTWVDEVERYVHQTAR